MAAELDMLRRRELRIERGLLGDVADTRKEFLTLARWLVQHECFTGTR